MKNQKQEKTKLSAQIRTLTGKKAKKLRKQGLIPANIYGPEFKSTSISINFKEFLNTYKIAKETGIVYLQLEKDEIPVLIKHIQKHPVSDEILHVDFRKIDLKKKIETEVPVKVVGTSEAVSQKGGVLLTQSEFLLVEALPEDIPQEIEVDISSIKDIGQEIKVADLKKSDKYTIKTSPDKVVVSVIAHKEESITPETTAAQPEVITKEKEEVEAEQSTEQTKQEPKPESTDKKQ